MAILNKQDAIDARVATDISPVETAINDYLTSQRVIDYLTSVEIANPSVRVNVDGQVLTKAALDAVKASVEAAGWKSVEVIQEAKRVVVAFSVEEKVVTPPVPDVYVATVAPGSASIIVGATAKFTATVTKNGQAYTATPTFSSATPGVATVAADGTVTGVAAGTSVITIAEAGKYSKTVTVTVTAA